MFLQRTSRFATDVPESPSCLPRFVMPTCNSICRILTVSCLSAIARHCAIGVDIEMIRPDTDIEKIAERFFSFAETEQLRAVNGLGKRTAFFNGWTRKEAYLKARGEGIGEGLDQFAVSLHSWKARPASV